jgi:hypothetical protein
LGMGGRQACSQRQHGHPAHQRPSPAPRAVLASLFSHSHSLWSPDF